MLTVGESTPKVTQKAAAIISKAREEVARAERGTNGQKEKFGLTPTRQSQWAHGIASPETYQPPVKRHLIEYTMEL